MNRGAVFKTTDYRLRVTLDLLMADVRQVGGASSLRAIEDTKPCVEWVLEYRTFADRNVEWSDEDFTSSY